MLLLLHRHADAFRADASRWPDDTERPVSPKGLRVEQRVVRALRSAGIAPAVMLTSPWRRARETASILRDGLGVRRRPVPVPALAAPPSARAIGEALAAVAPFRTVAVVGHEPWLGELASLLCTGSPTALRFDLPKSGLIGLELPSPAPGSATLRFFLRPRLL